MLIIIIIIILHSQNSPQAIFYSSFTQNNVFVEQVSTRSVAVATRGALRHLRSEAVKSDRTKAAGIISCQ